MSASSNSATVTTTAAFLAMVTQGASFVVQNLGTKVVAVGFGSNVSAANGVNLAAGTPGGSFSGGPLVETTELWAITASGTSKVVVAVIN